MTHYFYRMKSDEPDPRHSGDTRSWFFFYKWRADHTWVPATRDNEQAQPGDVLLFVMDDTLLGAATVLGVEHNMQGEKELHFDSNSILVPDVQMRVEERGFEYDGRRLLDIPEGEEPPWLKSFLTRKPL